MERLSEWEAKQIAPESILQHMDTPADSPQFFLNKEKTSPDALKTIYHIVSVHALFDRMRHAFIDPRSITALDQRAARFLPHQLPPIQPNSPAARVCCGR